MALSMILCPACSREQVRGAKTCEFCSAPLAGGAPVSSPADVGQATAVLSGILLVLAGLVAGGGVTSLSNATVGVGGIAAGCFIAIVARIAQASSHNRKVLAHLQLMSKGRGEGAVADASPAR